MAIFSFVKQAGQLVSDKIGQAAQAVKEETAAATPVATAAPAAEKPAVAVEVSESILLAKVKASKIKARDLSLKISNSESVKIYAVVDSTDDKEDLILLVGNTPGVAEVEDAIKVKPEGKPEVPAPKPRFYTVKAGDTLGDIAKAQLGSADRYMEIFNANRNILSNPDAIDIGQTLRLPQA